MANVILNKKSFDATSPGFIYAVIVGGLSIFALAGVNFPDSPSGIAGDITSSLSTGGFYAIIGIVAASVVFPIWNAVRKKTISFVGIFKNSLTWIAIGNIVLAGVSLFGLTFPDGTIEGLVGAVSARDWASLIGIVVTTIFPTIARYFKS